MLPPYLISDSTELLMSDKSQKSRSLRSLRSLWKRYRYVSNCLDGLLSTFITDCYAVTSTVAHNQRIPVIVIMTVSPLTTDEEATVTMFLRYHDLGWPERATSQSVVRVIERL